VFEKKRHFPQKIGRNRRKYKEKKLSKKFSAEMELDKIGTWPAASSSSLTTGSTGLAGLAGLAGGHGPLAATSMNPLERHFSRLRWHRLVYVLPSLPHTGRSSAEHSLLEQKTNKN
jgi:hypothetical protein